MQQLAFSNSLSRVKHDEVEDLFSEMFEGSSVFRSRQSPISTHPRALSRLVSAALTKPYDSESFEEGLEIALHSRRLSGVPSLTITNDSISPASGTDLDISLPSFSFERTSLETNFPDFKTGFFNLSQTQLGDLGNLWRLSQASPMISMSLSSATSPVNLETADDDEAQFDKICSQFTELQQSIYNQKQHNRRNLIVRKYLGQDSRSNGVASQLKHLEYTNDAVRISDVYDLYSTAAKDSSAANLAADHGLPSEIEQLSERMGKLEHTLQNLKQRKAWKEHVTPLEIHKIERELQPIAECIDEMLLDDISDPPEDQTGLALSPTEDNRHSQPSSYFSTHGNRSHRSSDSSGGFVYDDDESRQFDLNLLRKLSQLQIDLISMKQVVFETRLDNMRTDKKHFSATDAMLSRSADEDEVDSRRNTAPGNMEAKSSEKAQHSRRNSKGDHQIGVRIKCHSNDDLVMFLLSQRRIQEIRSEHGQTAVSKISSKIKDRLKVSQSKDLSWQSSVNEERRILTRQEDWIAALDEYEHEGRLMIWIS